MLPGVPFYGCALHALEGFIAQMPLQIFPANY